MQKTAEKFGGFFSVWKTISKQNRGFVRGFKFIWILKSGKKETKKSIFFNRFFQDLNSRGF